MAMIGNQETMPVKMPLVNQACENLSMQIADLNEQINLLLARVSMVSRAALPCESANKCENIKVSTPLGDMIDGYAERVFAMKSGVRDALDRLEI